MKPPVALNLFIQIPAVPEVPEALMQFEHGWHQLGLPLELASHQEDLLAYER
jgi:hypothetical protein